MKRPKFSRSFEVVSELPTLLRPLKRLASNFHWTWRHETRELFRAMDKELWDASNHNPVEFLALIPAERMQRLAEDPFFVAKLQHCDKYLDEYLSAETWFDRAYPGKRDEITVAYFCAEFGITEGLPIYSGGLGVLAGDHLKAASDLGIPLVGVGLLYARGYFRQKLSHDGWQQEVYPQYDFFQMPLEMLRGADDQPLRVEVELPDRVVTCQIWKATVGRIPLYLLDSNVLENEPTDQGITDTLYGGDEEMRIRQEMILGIGGMRALEALGVKPTVCHMNEGHAGFLAIERIRQFVIEHGCDFRTARQVIVSGNVFTTHTPVPAGFDLFAAPLLERYMGKMLEGTGLSIQQLLRLGRIDPDNQGEAFNMAVLAMENADRVNGVSKLHAEVSRGMFHDRWKNLPEDEVPIEAITNGIHTMTWVSKRMAELFDEYLGAAWRREPENPDNWREVAGIPDEELWSARENMRGDLVRFVRRRLQDDLTRRNAGRPDFGMISGILDPRVLTIGFARRFATYKRATLMLSDRERLMKILFHEERPIQIVMSGKSHPRDDGGKHLIQDLVNFINEGGARSRVVFLEDYDMSVARALVQGVDVWLNNPRRPLEASGTSGMKIVPNGGLNCSVLDGWWDEGYSPAVGFAIGDRESASEPTQQDWLDSHSLYQLLEHEIAPKFYHRVDNGLPTSWIAMMKESIMKLGPEFSTGRMVRDYASKFYVPAAEAYRRLLADDLQKAKEAVAWRDRIVAAWPKVFVKEVTDSAGRTNPVGAEVSVRTIVELGALSPSDVAVQVIAGKAGPNRDLLDSKATPLKHVHSDGSEHVFEAVVKCDRAGYCGYAVRVVPSNPDIVVSSELPLVCWEAA